MRDAVTGRGRGRGRGRRRLAAALALAVSVAVADAAAEGLVVEDAAEARASLDMMRAERPALAHFWATWCAPCLTELPRLAAMLRDEPDLAERVLIVSVDTKPIAKVEAFLRDRLDLSLATLRVVQGTPGMTYGVTSYPATLFLAADGTVSARIAGAAEWDDPALRARVQDHLAR